MRFRCGVCHLIFFLAFAHARWPCPSAVLAGESPGVLAGPPAVAVFFFWLTRGGGGFLLGLVLLP